MTRNADVVVIGGGVVGTAAAYFLKNEGVEVTLLEKEAIAAGSSGHGPGFFNTFGGDFLPGSHLSLALESIRLIREHRDALIEVEDKDDWFNDRPGLTLAFDDQGVNDLRKAYEANQSQLEAAGAGGEWLEAEDLSTQEPLLSRHVLGGYHFPSVIQIDGWQLAKLFAAAAKRRGAKIMQGEAIDFAWQGDRVTGVKLSKGEHLSCDNVVLAMGSWTPIASLWLGFPLPICNLKGQLHVLRAPGLALKHHVIERVALMQYPNGLFVLAATPDPAPGGGLRLAQQYIRPMSDSEAIPEDTDFLLEMGVARFPFLKDAEIVEDRSGGRPMSLDLVPMIGLTPTFENVYIAAGHGRKGIHLSSGTGKLVADLIVRGRSDMALDLNALSPARFTPDPL